MEALVVVRDDFAALFRIRPNSANVRHEHPRLSRDVRTQVPEVGQRVERPVCHFIHVINPVVLGLQIRLDEAEFVFTHVLHQIGNPIDVLLYGDQHIAQHRGTARARDHVHIGKARRRESQVGPRPVFPLLSQFDPSTPPDVDAENRARHGVEARGVDDAIDRPLAILVAYRVRRDLCDWGFADVYQLNVIAVVGLVVVGVDADSLRADGMVVGAE